MANSGGQYQKIVEYMDDSVVHSRMGGSGRKYTRNVFQRSRTFCPTIWTRGMVCVSPPTMGAGKLLQLGKYLD